MPSVGSNTSCRLGVLRVVGDRGKACNEPVGVAFHALQFLDGFKSIYPEERGVLSASMEMEGFEKVQQVDAIDTRAGTYCYRTANNPSMV